MCDIGKLELADVFDITVADFGRGVDLVFIKNALCVPLLDHACDGHNTASTMLFLSLVRETMRMKWS